MAEAARAAIIAADMSPLITALFIVLCVGLAGALAAFVRDRARYAGYRDIMRDAIAFARTIDGETFRDGNDLVVSGEYQRMPLVVRFSHAENTPGLSIRLGAPVTFQMGVYARGQHPEERRATVLRTSDNAFNMKFEVRASQPAEARLFLDSPRAVGALSRLCRSSYDFLTFAPPSIEFGQLGYPTDTTAKALPGYVEALGVLLGELKKMPGADQVKVEPRQRKTDYLVRATIAAGVIAVAATLYVTAHERPKQDQSESAEKKLPEGMTVADAAVIRNLENWRAATTNDADPTVVTWLRDHGVSFSPHVTFDADSGGDKNSAGNKDDSAYLLINDKGQRRVVIVVNSAIAYDARFPSIDCIARVPKSVIGQINWLGIVPNDVQGDGLLLVRNGEDPKSGLILFYSHGRILSAAPSDWQQVRIDAQ